VKLARARQFVEAVAAHEFEAATEFLDPDVETVTPRSTLRGLRGVPASASEGERRRAVRHRIDGV
jgi:hypothetical protein